MSGYFAAANKDSCTFDLFFGTDYHSHLGTRRAGMAVYTSDGGFHSAVHNIENTPFRTKFDKDLPELEGKYGIGCISDYEAQPILMKSHHGTFALTTVSKINNVDEIVNDILKTNIHFFVMGNGEINSTELIGALINQKDNLIEGIEYARSVIDGSVSMLLLTEKGIYAARDKLGRTPIILGKREDGRCAAFESHSFRNLGYSFDRPLGPGEIVFFNEKSTVTLVKPGDKMKICTFLWIYYGFPAASYEGVNVEQARYNCGKLLARRDENVDVDLVAGIPDSGVAHAIGYSTESGKTYGRPFVKYTPTWPRSFMPTIQTKRDLIAHMKLLPITDLIREKRLLLIDDSIVRGTQLRETAEFLFNHGAKEVHVRPACPPLLYGCKYLNFSRSNSAMELITRRVIEELEGTINEDIVKQYVDPDSEKYQIMVDAICKKLGFTSLRFHRLDDMLDAIGIGHDLLCTYCWDGKE